MIASAGCEQPEKAIKIKNFANLIALNNRRVNTKWNFRKYIDEIPNQHGDNAMQIPVSANCIEKLPQN